MLDLIGLHDRLRRFWWADVGVGGALAAVTSLVAVMSDSGSRVGAVSHAKVRSEEVRLVLVGCLTCGDAQEQAS